MPPALSNLVANGSFEELDASGRPVPWRLPDGYSVVTNSPASGERCLHYQNTDTSHYQLAQAPVPLRPGEQYELRAKIRTNEIRGRREDEGATICVEWQSSDGTYLGGAYPRGVTGTHREWVEIRHVLGPIPSNAARANVVCYLRRGTVGEAWWDDVSIRLRRPPLLGAVTSDHYRDQFTGRAVRVFASHALPAHALDVRRASIELRATTTEGRELARLDPSAVTEDALVFSVDTTAWPTGPLELIVSGRDSFGQVHERRLPAIRLTEPPPNRRCWIDDHRRLIVDGKPFFPLGMYWGNLRPDQVALYARSPFNCLMPYGNIGRDGLDLAWSNGLRVIYSVKDLYVGHAGLTSRDAADEAVRRTVESLRDHPAIIAWYINDEFPLSRFGELLDRQRRMIELDPGRPTWAVLYQIGELREYVATCDVIGTDPYPIPHRSPAQALDWARRSRAETFGVKPIWMVPQVFNWAAYKDRPDQLAACRAPSLDEMRAMAWSCLAAGANGLIFYSWFDLWRLDEGRGKGGQPIPRDPFEKRWRDVVTMASEIRDFVPMLLSTEPAPPIEVSGEGADVAARAVQHEGRVYLLAVNAGTSQVARLSFRGGRMSRVVRQLLGALPPLGSWNGELDLPPLTVALFETGD